MHGGVILFRGTGADARRYVEADRSRADDYYLGDDASVAQFTTLDSEGNVTAALGLDPETYAGWVDWVNPVAGESMGIPRLPGQGRQGSPRFAEMVVNTPKSLSIAAALHPKVSDALDRAQQDAVAEIQRWVAQHSVTRVGPRGRQEVVPAREVQTVAVSHRTSRAGDPHRHIHFQIGTRVQAAGKWRALDTAALFKQQGAIRALGTAVIAAHPELAEVLDRHGLTLDTMTGEVVELERFNPMMSKRGEQVRKHLERFEAWWEAAHPGETMGPVVSARLAAKAWAHERPAKKPTTLREEQAWIAELREAGYDPDTLQRPAPRARVSLDDLAVQTVASRALDRCAAGGSAWTRHTVQEHATRIMTDDGVHATPAEIREFVNIATGLALEDCFSILSPGAPTPEHVAHLTSVRVVQAETELRDFLAARVPKREPRHPDLHETAHVHGLDAGQTIAAAAVASRDPLVVVEGAAGAGKTTMLGAAIEVAAQHGRAARVVAPTLRAAQVAHEELGVPATSVAALVHVHGWRWNDDGVWTRLVPGDTDPETGRTYRGPTETARLVRGERVIVDEAGMLDQDTALALLTITAEAKATVALVGDRALLPAVGRGGVLDMAAQIRGRTFDMAEVHRFTDPAYADLTLRMRDGTDPGDVFDRLAQQGLVRLHSNSEDAHAHVAEQREDGEAVTVSTNDEARTVNAAIREERVAQGVVDDTRTVNGSDDLAIGAGDVIQTRQNDSGIGVANPQQRIVQRVEDDGALRVREHGNGLKQQHTVRLPAEYVAEHAHLSYAATSYGVQGATVAGAHTLLTDATSAASVYVGMTRGRETNLLHVVAESEADAQAQFIEAMARDRADRGLTTATQRATEAVAGLTDDGPMRFVNEEIAALMHRAQTAEVQAQRWQRVGTALADLRERETVVRERARAAEEAAKQRVVEVRAEVATPFVSAAEAALSDWHDADTAAQRASDQVQAASWFGKRRARTDHETAQARAQQARQHLTDEWGGPPKWNEQSEAWVQRVTGPLVDGHPRVIDAEHEHRQARDTLIGRPEQAQMARLAAYARVFGTDNVLRNRESYLSANPARQGARAAQAAKQAREEADVLATLTPAEATARIEQTRAEQAACEAQRVERERARQDIGREHRSTTPRRDGPGLSL
ncbi:MobF family relaxase [Microbacterium amylolyticum]|nr:MobF family relaxase [Microbacterium amylolyticum]